jgi:hypothetical protein
MHRDARLGFARRTKDRLANAKENGRRMKFNDARSIIRTEEGRSLISTGCSDRSFSDDRRPDLWVSLCGLFRLRHCLSLKRSERDVSSLRLVARPGAAETKEPEAYDFRETGQRERGPGSRTVDRTPTPRRHFAGYEGRQSDAWRQVKTEPTRLRGVGSRIESSLTNHFRRVLTRLRPQKRPAIPASGSCSANLSG